jgi:hypothetical protein
MHPGTAMAQNASGIGITCYQEAEIIMPPLSKRYEKVARAHRHLRHSLSLLIIEFYFSEKIFVENKTVDRQINQNNQSTKDVQRKDGKVCGINQWDKIPNDKVSTVSASAAQQTKMIFQWSQRTNPSGKFNKSSPERSGQMQKKRMRPADDQQTTRHDKGNEQKMKNNHRISKQ